MPETTVKIQTILFMKDNTFDYKVEDEFAAENQGFEHSVLGFAIFDDEERIERIALRMAEFKGGRKVVGQRFVIEAVDRKIAIDDGIMPKLCGLYRAKEIAPYRVKTFGLEDTLFLDPDREDHDDGQAEPF